jgi:hypothetical protein
LALDRAAERALQDDATEEAKDDSKPPLPT